MANQHRHQARNLRGIPKELWEAYKVVAGEGQRSVELRAFMEFRTGHPEVWQRLVQAAEADGKSPFALLTELIARNSPS